MAKPTTQFLEYPFPASPDDDLMVVRYEGDEFTIYRSDFGQIEPEGAVDITKKHQGEPFWPCLRRVVPEWMKA
jgi:hypothetical protein